MPRDIPYVGVTYSPETKPNSEWYLRSVLKSNAVKNPFGSLTLDSTAPSPLFSNITGRTYGFNIRRGTTYELGRIESGECQLSVNNSDGLFDPNNSSSTYYPDIKPYRPLKINCAYPTTGNILNDTNLADPIPADAPDSYGDNKISVGVNDGNFELGVISNWYTSGTATITTSSALPHTGTYNAVITSPDSNSYAYLDVPVVAGKEITVSIYYKSPVAAKLTVFDGGLGSYVGYDLTLGVTGTWKRLSRTLTPASPKITIRIGYSATSATIQLDDVQVEFAAVETNYTTTGPTIYNLFNGFVERYPQTYQAPNRGQVNMYATDSIASLSQNTLVSPYEALILQDKALYYYPFNDPNDSGIALNKSLYGQPAMELTQSGSGGAVEFGVTSAVEGIPNIASTNISIANNITSYWINGVWQPGLFMSTSNVQNIDLTSGKTFTFTFWVNWQPETTLGGTVVFHAHSATQWNSNKQGLVVTVSNDFSGISGIEAELFDSNGNSVLVLFENLNLLTAAGWQMYSVELSYSGVTASPATGDYTMFVRTETPTGISPITSTTVPYIPLQSFSFFGVNLNSAETAQNIANFSVHDSVIPDFDAYVRAGKGLYGDTTGTRLKDFVNTYSGMDYLPYVTDAGKSAMQYAPTYGIPLGDYVQTINDTEGGYWFVDGEGFLTFKDRWNRLQKLSPSVTFGDGAGEIPYAGGDLVINYDPTYVLNDMTVTRKNGITAQAQDTQSVADYFPRSYNRVIEGTSDSQTVDMANFLLSRYKQPNSRPETITLTPARNPAIWSTVLSLEIGDYVRVNKDPLGAPALSIDCFIEQVEHSFDGQTGDWITKVTVSPAISEYWNLSTIQATTTGTASAGNLVLNKTGATDPDLTNPRDIVAGQMLQYTISGTTYVDVVRGAITESINTVTVPVWRVGSFTAGTNTIKSSTLKSFIPVDYVTVAGGDSNFGLLNDSNLVGAGFTAFLVNGEIMYGTVSSGYIALEPSARAQNNTKQFVQGSTAEYGNITLVMSHTASHLAGSTVYGVDGTLGGNVPSGTIVTEYLPNQTTRLPYAPFNYSLLNSASTLSSFTNTLAQATIPATTPASGIKYNTALINPLIDQGNNYPSSNLATGQMLSFYNNSAVESFAIANVSSPNLDGTFYLTGYKITDSTRTLSAAIGVDAVTVTCSGAVTASAILIGNEFMQVTAGSGTTTLTVTRGTPDAAVWSVLTTSPHYQYDKIYTIVNAGLTNTYAIGNAVIEGYNVSTPVIGTTKLGY